ncbi:CopG family transcriptional regulator [Halorhodospira neutriphila]|uniref:CopG family transcriptional regulator n=1 Tax=Halorhodospira neutriphila TaxID=168379 RepID=A0ABS1E7C9_9GAMM|nr:CopG family transcriptional regulator [Halorhodospira neutriphila]
MGEVTIYLDDEHERRLKRAAQSAGLPVSRWVAYVIEEHTCTQWPESIQAMAGTWKDFPTAEELRQGSAADSARESL